MYLSDQNDKEVFTYDKLGNREQVVNRDGTIDTYNNNIVNEYTQIAINNVPRTPLYDPAGNMTKNYTNGRTYYYNYDYENRLNEITREILIIAFQSFIFLKKE